MPTGTFNNSSCNNLQIVSWNAGGIKGKFREFKYFIDEKQPDIVGLQETYLNPGVKLTIPNYTTYRNDRLTHRGGSTALLIKNSINHHPTPVFTSTFENTSVSIDLPNNNRFQHLSSPHGRIDTQDLNNIFNLSLKGIAVGDFNAKHPAWSQSRSNINGSIIHNHIANNNLVLLAPLEPTHFPYHHPSSSTLYFGIMKNFSTGNATSINDLSSDHNPVTFDININSNLSSGSKNINITTWKTFCELIHNSIPGNPKMDTEAEIDEEIQKFTCCITSAINLSTRTKVISGPFRQLSKEILSKIKIKNRLRKLYQITFFPPYKRKAYKLQKEIQTDIKNL
ncbi:hypothetical protein AVEN_47851-1 [Araneus ventricosus]|uniref:Endonuclease/exonuclease/phosphatase domain-containing protein n=1 Tax=Araneus ventricosus TaxID=182803 RepID=A0A4Y2PVQ5_ARAVE|nr:hypothetical protein AVEN_47851-1 [Araneus ventricosus]